MVIKEKIVEVLYLSNIPANIDFDIGEAFTQTYGKIEGAKSENAFVLVDLGTASDFIKWDSDTNTISVEEGATDLSHIGEHIITMVIFD